MVGKQKRKWHGWLAGVVMVSLLALLCAQSLADESCLVAFLGPGQGWSSLTAPVIPPEKTLSSNRVYLGLFRAAAGPMWEGDVVRFGLSAENVIVDKNGDPALDSTDALEEIGRASCRERV